MVQYLIETVKWGFPDTPQHAVRHANQILTKDVQCTIWNWVQGSWGVMRKLVALCRIRFHTHVGDWSTACVRIRVLQAGISHGLDCASGIRYQASEDIMGSYSRALECHRGTILLQYLPKSHTWEDQQVDYSHVPTPNTIRVKKIASGILDISTIKLPFLGLANWGLLSVSAIVFQAYFHLSAFSFKLLFSYCMVLACGADGEAEPHSAPSSPRRSRKVKCRPQAPHRPLTYCTI